MITNTPRIPAYKRCKPSTEKKTIAAAEIDLGPEGHTIANYRLLSAHWPQQNCHEETMKKSILSILALMALTTASVLSAADMPGPAQPEEMKWAAAPPVLPEGAKMTILAGDPSTTGFVSLRLKMPAGYRIPPHSHPTDEHVTVISGTFAIGMGDKLDKTQSKTLKPGGYGVAPANMHHFAWTKTGAVVQVDFIGPFQITYVNPADSPSPKR